MKKAKLFMFTSPTCHNCPPAKREVQLLTQERDDFEFIELATDTVEGAEEARNASSRSATWKCNLWEQPTGRISVAAVNEADDVELRLILLREPWGFNSLSVSNYSVKPCFVISGRFALSLCESRVEANSTTECPRAARDQRKRGLYDADEKCWFPN